MSLINEALKRTKDVQQKTPTAADGPELRPVDPAQTKAAGGAKTLLFVMVLAVILGNFLLWMAFKDRNTQSSNASAPESGPATPEAKPASLPTPPASVEPAPPADVTPATSPESVTTPTPPEQAAAATPSTNGTAAEPRVVFAEPERPAVLRLQSIIYGTRPSAMIGGKFLFVGDRIQGHQVIAIDRETVTLVGEGQTNVLSLP